MEVREILLDFIGCFWILRDAIGYKYYIYIYIHIYIYIYTLFKLYIIYILCKYYMYMIMITIQQSNMASWRILLKRRLTNGNILYKRGIFQKSI
jgi:hypothetical protein